MKLTQDQLDTFHRDGSIMVEDVFNPEEMSAALSDMEKIFYGNSFGYTLWRHSVWTHPISYRVRCVGSID